MMTCRLDEEVLVRDELGEYIPIPSNWNTQV